MRFMVLVKADKDSEAGVMPSRELLTNMGKFNEELVKAGVMLAGDGLAASSQGCPRQIHRQKDVRHRRPVCRNEGAGRRLLDLAVQVARRGHRLAQTRTVRRHRSRNSPNL